MNKKKLIALALSLGLVAGAAGTMNLVTANAAIKEQNVADTILTTTGDIHVDWEAKGDTASTSFVSNAQGDVFNDEKIPWAVGWLAAWDTATFADGNVTMSFDVYDWKSLMLRPYLASATVDSALDTVWINGELVNMTAHIGWQTNAGEFYTDETLTTLYDRGAVSDGGLAYKSLAFFYPMGYPVAAQPYHVEFVFTVDGTLGIKSYAMNEDGTYGAAPTYQIWMAKAFSGLDTTTNYYFGVNYTGGSGTGADGNLMIDNFKLATPTRTVMETDFSGNWATFDGVPATGKLHNSHGKTKTIAEVLLNPANGDRLVTFDEVTADASLNQVFKLSGEMDIRALGKKFGIATGLDDQMGDVYAEGTSYVYFSQVDGATYLTPVNNGVEGTPVSFGADLMTGDFYDFEFVGTKTGATFTLDGHTVEFELANVEGFLAFVTDGEGEASVALGGETKLIRYAYRGSQGGAIANNFNTGYVNPANWESNTLNAVMVANPEEARGIVFEDGKVKFDGTADSSYFGTSEFYSDYVVEFLYSDSFDGDKPALKETWTAGYSCLSLNMGVINAGSGWANNSMMLFIDDGAFNMLNFKTGTGAGDLRAINYNFSGAAAGEVKTTAIKIVVANNTVKAYYQEVVEGVEPTAEAYILGGEWVVPEIYGKVAFATTDSGFFALDDIRITPIDDPNPETVLANAEAYVSFAPIADEYRPFTLEAPELTMEGTTVMWEAVEEATGYVVNVNGTETTVGADVLSFEVDCSEPGDYVVTVKALGNGAHISDSYQSEPIEFTVQAAGGEDSSVPTTSEEPAPAPAPSKGGLFDCNNVVGGTMVPTIAAFAVAMLLKKRKED